MYLPESAIAAVNMSSEIQVGLDAIPGKQVVGRVRSIIPSVDKSSRRFEVNITVPDDASLIPGMFGRARIALGSRSVLAVPERSLTQRGGLSGVFVVDDMGRMAFRWVRPGVTHDGMREILTGLTEGETIVEQGDARVHDGMLPK